MMAFSQNVIATTQLSDFDVAGWRPPGDWARAAMPA
jgi:hypothetical protein